MKFGILKDIKDGEYRVIATPAEVATLIQDGNEVYVQHGAGEKAGFVKKPVLLMRPMRQKGQNSTIRKKKSMQTAIL